MESGGHLDSGSERPTAPDPARLLIVDDDTHFAITLGAAVETMGYTAEIATSGQDALARFQEAPPAGVLLDLRMPDMDGAAVFSALRRLDPSVPVIIVTGTLGETAPETLLNEGVFDYLRKPIDMDHLEAVVEAAVTTSRHADASRRAGRGQTWTRLLYSLVGIVRHLPGPRHAGREHLEALALEALRQTRLGHPQRALAAFRAIHRELDAGRLAWLDPADADRLRAALDPLEMGVAQHTTKVFRIGGVLSGPRAARLRRWTAFSDALRALGWIDGQNVRLQLCGPDQEDTRVDEYVDDLLRRGVDVIVASPDVTVRVARRAGGIAVVSTGVVDRDLRAEPNVTGVRLEAGAFDEARVQILHEVVPELSRIAVLVPHLNAPGLGASLRAIEAAAAARALGVLVLEAPYPAALARKVAAAAQGAVGGLIVHAHDSFTPLTTRIAELAIDSALPTISGLPGFADAGGLVAYVANPLARYRQAATFVDKLLRGTTPAALPAEPPAPPELVVNLKTAKALGLAVPRPVLLRADRVIG